MPKNLGPRDAECLIAAGELDVVDVRGPAEWQRGHVPGARNVPLDELRADPRGKLPRETVLFVCQKGIRSVTAAQVAEAQGYRDVYSLEGGMEAWASAGLPVDLAPEPAAPAKPSEPLADAGASCGLPEPGLDVVVGANLRELRAQRSLSLDALAQVTGLSRTLLGQIELGKVSPSVAVVWRIAQAFGVQFSALLQTSERVETSVLRAAGTKRLVAPDGRFASRPLYPLASKPAAEFYELFLAAHSREDAQAHQPGTRENLIVTTGRLELELGGQRFELGKGDAILFSADAPHSYVNPGSEDCWMYLVMTYASGSR